MVSSDEKTGIQALESLRVASMKAGQIEKCDPEHKRNGTQCLIAGRDVKTGQILQYSIGDTRTEQDYLEHIQAIVAIAPTEPWIIVCDQLNTHMSASLVEWIAKQIGFEEDLGKKGYEGILKSKKSRKQFLEDEKHRIRFAYTPKHCSWLNQIENWFGLLQRKVIKRGQFSSTDDLKRKIIAFIEYYNNCLARPYKWKANSEKLSKLFMN